MSNEQKLREAFELGWNMAAQWSLSDHLLADMESPAYLTERDGLLQALATTEPAVNQRLTTEPFDEREAFTDDTRDAARYRWLADCNNYAEAARLISDGSLTEDALGKAIDAAMAEGVKG